MELEGARVPVAGGSPGNDARLARAQAAAGAQVVVARSGDDLRAAADEVGGAAHVADLSDPEVVDGLVAAIEDAHGPIDVPVDNAGIGTVDPVATVDPVDRRLLYACSASSRRRPSTCAGSPPTGETLSEVTPAAL